MTTLQESSHAFMVLQNDPALLAQQAAAREWYGEGVRWSHVRLMTVVLLPLGWGVMNTVWAIALPGIAPTVLGQSRVWAAAAGLSLAIADYGWIKPGIDRVRRAAAVAQEMFDTTVLDLPWNALLVGARHQVADIAKRGAGIVGDRKAMDLLKGWYTPDLAGLPFPMARLMAQRMNVWWDRSLREEYVKPLRITIAVVVAGVTVVALATGQSLAIAVLVFASLLPGLRVWNEELASHQRTRERHETILAHLASVRDALRGGRLSDADAREESRKLQDAIFQQRAAAPLGVPKTYWRSRDANEDAYRQEVRLLAEAATGNIDTSASRVGR